MSIRPEDILIAAAEVSVYLARQQGVFGNVRPAGVVVQRQQEEPGDTNDDAQEGQIWWELQDARVASQAESLGCRE